MAGETTTITDTIQRHVANADVYNEMTRVVKMWTALEKYPVLWVEPAGVDYRVRMTTFNGTALPLVWSSPLNTTRIWAGANGSQWTLVRPSATGKEQTYNAVLMHSQLLE